MNIKGISNTYCPYHCPYCGKPLYIDNSIVNKFICQGYHSRVTFKFKCIYHNFGFPNEYFLDYIQYYISNNMDLTCSYDDNFAPKLWIYNSRSSNWKSYPINKSILQFQPNQIQEKVSKLIPFL